MISREKKAGVHQGRRRFLQNCGSGNISAAGLNRKARKHGRQPMLRLVAVSWNYIYRLIIGVNTSSCRKDDPMIQVVFDNKESADEHPETA